MKTIKLSIASLAIMSVVSTSSATSLEEVFKNGKVSGVIQSYYFARDKDSGTDNDIMTLGFDLSYETARYNGFGLKTTFQSASSPWADEAAKTARKSNMYGSGGELSELYLSYSIDNTLAKVGRMYFWSPTLGGSGSRVTKEAFQGIVVKNSDISDTTLTLAYMNKFQRRTDSNGGIGKFTKTFTTAASPWAFELNDGAYAIAVKNKSIKNLILTTAYVDAVDAFKTAYFEAAYKFNNIGIATQYYDSEEEGKDGGNLFGIKADVTFGPINLLAAYTTTDDTEDVIPGVGNGADMAYTWSEVFAYQYDKDQDSYKVAAKYKINPNASIGTSYVNEDGPGYERAYTAIKGSYSFDGELKGLNIKAAYEMGSKDAKDNELRVRLNYKF